MLNILSLLGCYIALFSFGSCHNRNQENLIRSLYQYYNANFNDNFRLSIVPPF